MPILSTLGGIGCGIRGIPGRRVRGVRRIGRRINSRRGLGYFTCPPNVKDGRTRKRHAAINRYTAKHKINKLHFSPTISKRVRLKRVRLKRGLHGLLGVGAFKGDSCAHRFNRSHVGHKVKHHYMKGGEPLLGIGNFLGGANVRRRKSLGRTLARRFKVGKRRCKKAGKRKVCRTAKGKGFIRRDKVGKKHRASGKFMLARSLGGFGGIGMPSFRMPSSRIRRSSRRRSRRSRGFSLRGFGLGAISVPSSVKSLLPPINKEFLMKSATIVSGALIPLTLSRMGFVPKKWQVGWRGLLTYTIAGGVFLGVGNKVEFIRKRHADLTIGFGAGLVLQIMQNYIFKRTLIPSANVKAIPALSGLDACTSCDNAEGCGDIGDCIGYSDGTGDFVLMEDEELIDDVMDGLDSLEDGDFDDELFDELED